MTIFKVFDKITNQFYLFIVYISDEFKNWCDMNTIQLRINVDHDYGELYSNSWLITNITDDQLTEITLIFSEDLWL